MPDRLPDAPTVGRELAEEAATGSLPVAGGGPLVQMAAVEADEGTVRKKLGLAFWLSAAWLGLLVASCALAPILPIPTAVERDPAWQHLAPFEDMSHPLGGDGLGRDMTSRLVYGARNSLFIGVVSIIIGVLVGGLAGLVAGYFRGRRESVLMALTDVLLAIPALILALSLSIFLEPKIGNVFKTPETAGRVTLTLALGLVSIPTLARITRANTLVWSQREFVTAARAQGAKNFRIMFREVLPNVVPAMAAIALLGVAVVIIAEASISLLGAGIDLPAPTWGNIIFEGRADFSPEPIAPYIVFEPAIVIFLTVLSLNFLGDAVRARFEVREAQV